MKKQTKNTVRPPGRPTKYSDELCSKIVELAKTGKTEVEIANEIGLSRTTLHYWKERHAAFLNMMQVARGTAVKLVEASLFQRALGYSHPEVKVFCSEGVIYEHVVEKHYPPDTKACETFLTRFGGKRWRKFKPMDYPKEGEEDQDVRNLSDDDLIKELKLLNGGKK